MRFPIRPGKVTCAGIVAIFLVLPNSMWKGADAKVERVARAKVQHVDLESGSARAGVKFRKVLR